MAERQLNPRQLRAVEAEANTVVTAGAGSGKTTVLALRYLRLIREGRARVEEILTLTFTRRAAAEMYDRIHRLLAAEQDNPLIREQLARFDQAQISTLDSFCSQIVRGDCARFGVPRDFRLDADESDRMIRETALEFILARRKTAAMERLLEDFGFDRVWEEVWVSLGRSHISLTDPADFAGLAEIQLRQMRSDLEAALAEWDPIREALLDLDPAAGKSVADAREMAGGIPSSRELLSSGGDPSPEQWRRLAERFYPAETLRMPGGRSEKEDILILKELTGELRRVIPRILGCCTVLAEQDHVRQVSRMAGEFQEILLEQKRRQGLLVFQDLAELAVEILKTNPELRRFYKKRFRYLMIDEFQDNNRLQRDLLYLLAEKEGSEGAGIPAPGDLAPDKLYFVGDEKQSIYRFRGADVSVFKGLARELSSVGGERIDLNTNYRSEPELIRFFNTVFPRVMGEGRRDFEAEFLPLESRPQTEPSGAAVRLFYTDFSDFSPELLSGQEMEALAVARFIRDSVKEGLLPVRKQGILSPADYRDFALLLRSGSNQIYYERFFRYLGIPYEVNDVRSLFLEAPVNDLYSLLQLLVYPEDRESYAAVLRSPLVRLGDDSLTALFLAEDPEISRRPFCAAGEALLLREEDLRKYRKAGELYRSCAAAADREPPGLLLDRIWYGWGYRYTLLTDPGYHNYLEYFDYLSALAEAAEGRGLSLASFLDEIRPLLGQNEKLPELTVMKPPVQGVRIMTIHASKGLEFPVTILGDCGNTGRGSLSGGAPCLFSRETGLSLRLTGLSGKEKTEMGNPVYARAAEDEEEREMAELKRLLYVGMTRSESHLILAGRHTRRNRKTEKSLLNLFLSGFGWEPGTELSEVPELQDILVPMKTVSRQDLRREFAARTRRAPRETLGLLSALPVYLRQVREDSFGVTRYLALHEEPGNGQGGVSPRTGGTAGQGELFDLPEGERLPSLKCDSLLAERGWETLFGSLCHLLLEEELRGIRKPGLRENLLIPLEEKEARLLLEEAERLKALFLETELARKLKGADRLEPEVSFLLRRQEPEGPLYLRGQIDLLAVFGSGELWVTDFKTDREKLPAAHEAQLAVYREAAESLDISLSPPPGGWRIRSFLCYLRDGSVHEVFPD